MNAFSIRPADQLIVDSYSLTDPYEIFSARSADSVNNDYDVTVHLLGCTYYHYNKLANQLTMGSPLVQLICTRWELLYSSQPVSCAWRRTLL